MTIIKSMKWLLAISLTGLWLSACTKKEEDRIACAFSVRVLILNFNVVDAATQQDLYFSNNSRFSTKDIYIFKKEDISRKDTIRPNVMGVGDNRYFSIPLGYESEYTFILKTGNLTDNTVTYQVGKTETVCPNYQVKQVSFNGTVLKANDSGIYTFPK
jgi:hypothetical protein